MPHDLKPGQPLRKRHLKCPPDVAASFKGEGLHHEHVITMEGFDRAYSMLYLQKPPTRVKKIKLVRESAVKPAAPSPLRHQHLKSFTLPRRGDPYAGRLPLRFKRDMTCSPCRPATAMEAGDDFYRDGPRDVIISVCSGGGWLATHFGRLRYRQDDGIVIPRGTISRLVPDDVAQEDHLIIESAHPVRIPPRYLQPEGQIRMGAPDGERDCHGPAELMPNEPKAQRTDERAVMFDTQYPLQLTEEALALDHPNYPLSWLD